MTHGDKTFYPGGPLEILVNNTKWDGMSMRKYDHEDNEMMRPDTVRMNPLAPPPEKRLLVQGIDC